MKWIAAGLLAIIVLTLPAAACESYVEDVRSAGAAFRAHLDKSDDIQQRYSDLGHERDDILAYVEYSGPYHGWEQELAWIDEDMITVRLEWDAEMPEGAAAEAALTAALDAHVGACRSAARPGLLLEEAGLYLD